MAVTIDEQVQLAPVLLLCGRVARFRELSEYEYMIYQAEKRRINMEILDHFPAIKGDEDHPDNALADARYMLEAVQIPLVQAAWDGPDPCPTAVEMMQSKPAGQIRRCVQEIAKINPGISEVQGNSLRP